MSEVGFRIIAFIAWISHRAGVVLPRIYLHMCGMEDSPLASAFVCHIVSRSFWFVFLSRCLRQRPFGIQVGKGMSSREWDYVLNVFDKIDVEPRLPFRPYALTPIVVYHIEPLFTWISRHLVADTHGEVSVCSDCRMFSVFV